MRSRVRKYKLRLTRKEAKEIAYAKLGIIAAAVLGLGAVVWLAWVRPIQKMADISSFATCKAAGNQIQETYPEVCLTSDGKRFANPDQTKAHEASLKNDGPLLPPTDPALLKLDVDEWKVEVPLDNNTFDLIYTYFNDNGIERLTFTFKRLVNAGICKSDIGLTLSRSTVLNLAPYTPAMPAPTAHVGDYYFYPAFAGSPCYDPTKADQAALVNKIAGGQTLTQTVETLLGKLKSMPPQ